MKILGIYKQRDDTTFMVLPYMKMGSLHFFVAAEQQPHSWLVQW